MSDDHEVGGPLVNLLDQILDWVIRGEVFGLPDLASRPEGGGDDLCGLLCPELPAVEDGNGAQTRLRQEGNYFAYFLGALRGERPEGFTSSGVASPCCIRYSLISYPLGIPEGNGFSCRLRFCSSTLPHLAQRQPKTPLAWRGFLEF